MNPPKQTAAKTRTKTGKAGPPPLKDSAQEAISHFLETLDGEPCSELYDMVLHQVEEPLFRAVLDYTKHNQSHAAAMLGLNRGTLRKKLRQHGLLAEAEPPKRRRAARAQRASVKNNAVKRKR